ncbi:hypothetical protein [Ktedonobacter robiniae]|uniref:Ribbon-helix-helix protein CopG domain-containing protein n=1 Tax=Ktedonobacter robiniae TaxID=2778365 RepID=A0ABQ3V2R5_9CHLR|nr:hypothetical protein [Ktedonobacter robiniae]GHO59169.1 hypothetical protein KSB_76440 [Ktedonobacter robiniae]
MSNPISLRNIPPHALELAQQLCDHTGLSIADVLRQAIVSGLLVEATKFAPCEDGTLGGVEPARLAKALRRHLSSAIDVLLEYDEHPYQQDQRKEKSAQILQVPLQDKPAEATSETKPRQEAIFDETIGEDLDMLGMGFGLSGG